MTLPLHRSDDPPRESQSQSQISLDIFGDVERRHKKPVHHHGSKGTHRVNSTSSTLSSCPPYIPPKTVTVTLNHTTTLITTQVPTPPKNTTVFITVTATVFAPAPSPPTLPSQPPPPPSAIFPPRPPALPPVALLPSPAPQPPAGVPHFVPTVPITDDEPDIDPIVPSNPSNSASSLSVQPTQSTANGTITTVASPTLPQLTLSPTSIPSASTAPADASTLPAINQTGTPGSRSDQGVGSGVIAGVFAGGAVLLGLLAFISVRKFRRDRDSNGFVGFNANPRRKAGANGNVVAPWEDFGEPRRLSPNTDTKPVAPWNV